MKTFLTSIILAVRSLAAVEFKHIPEELARQRRLFARRQKLVSWMKSKKKKRASSTGPSLLMRFGKSLTSPATIALAAIGLLVGFALVKAVLWVGGLGIGLIKGMSWGLGTAVVILIPALLFELIYFREESTEAGSWKKSWREKRSKFYFMLLWVAVIVALSKMMQHLGSTLWWSLWLFKGEGGWLFYLVHILLIAGMWFAVNFEQGKLRVCGLIFVALGIGGALSTYLQTGHMPQIAERAREGHPQQVSLGDPTPIPRLTRKEEIIRVPKGTWSMSIRADDVIAVEDVEGRYVRYDRDTGPGKLWPIGPKNVIPFSAVTQQFMSTEKDFVIKYWRIAPVTEPDAENGQDD